MVVREVPYRQGRLRSGRASTGHNEGASASYLAKLRRVVDGAAKAPKSAEATLEPETRLQGNMECPMR